MKFPENKKRFSKIQGRIYLLTLIILLLAGALLRFYNLGWDQGYFFNPDERDNIIFPATDLKFPFKPSQFTYGSLTIYLYRLGGELMAKLTGHRFWLDASHLVLVGRFFSALASFIIIFLVYWLGKKFFSKKIGLIAAALTGFNVGLIQASHFGTTETILTFGGFLICLAGLLLHTKTHSKLAYVVGGLALGLSLSAKASAFVFFPPFFLAHLLSLKKKLFIKKNVWFLLSVLLTLLVFFLVSPYALFESREFFDSFLFQKRVATGEVATFYTDQFRETPRYLFQLLHVFPWILGWPVLILGALGAVLVARQGLREKNKKMLVLFSFPAFYFLYNGSLFVKWTRYCVPLCPFFCLFAAISIVKFYPKAKRQNLPKLLVSLLAAGVLIFQFFYALAFFHIYRQPDSRIMASNWIYQNIPPQSTLLLEPLDVVALPLAIGNLQPSLYKQIWFDFYGLDDGNKAKKATMIKELSAKLTETDYIVIGSRRIWANRLRLKGKFPLAARYYALLFSGGLGFNRAGEISSPPKFFGLEMNDNGAEETFQVFDHPTVMVYRKTKPMQAENYESLLRI